MIAASLRALKLRSASTELRDKLEARSAIGRMHLCGRLCRPPGVSVDEGAILGAGAIVLKDVKPWMIVIENMARD